MPAQAIDIERMIDTALISEVFEPLGLAATQIPVYGHGEEMFQDFTSNTGRLAWHRNCGGNYTGLNPYNPVTDRASNVFQVGVAAVKVTGQSEEQRGSQPFSTYRYTEPAELEIATLLPSEEPSLTLFQAVKFKARHEGYLNPAYRTTGPQSDVSRILYTPKFSISVSVAAALALEASSLSLARDMQLPIKKVAKAVLRSGRMDKKGDVLLYHKALRGDGDNDDSRTIVEIGKKEMTLIDNGTAFDLTKRMMHAFSVGVAILKALDPAEVPRVH